MESDNTIVLTRRIQLIINADKEGTGTAWKTLYQWSHACTRAANYIFTHLYVQEQLSEMLYLADHIQTLVCDHAKDSNGILNSSRIHSTYRVLAKHFKGSVPMHILSSLNMTLNTCFHKEKQQYREGERSLRNYKKGMPIPFRGTDIKQWQLTSGGNYSFSLFGICFRTWLGRDTEKKQLLDAMMQGAVQLCTSSIQLRDNKIFLLAAFRMPKERHELDATIIAEAALSIDFPVMVTIGKSHYTIGNKEEFLYRRLAIQSARSRLQRASSYTLGGKGSAKKLKALNTYEHAEHDYTESKLHLYSRRLIDICVQHRAATLLLTGQQEKEAIAKEEPFLLRNWGYYSLKEKIAYKAAKAGIEVIEE